jgi:hypothetical protein
VIAYEVEVVNMTLEDAKVLYPGEWIAFRAFEEKDNPEGELVLHNKDRRAFDKELLERGLINVYITFSGPPIPEGYAMVF